MVDVGRQQGALTIKLLEHPIDGAGAATAAHADIELVRVLGGSGSGIHDVGHCVWLFALGDKAVGPRECLRGQPLRIGLWMGGLCFAYHE